MNQHPTDLKMLLKDPSLLETRAFVFDQLDAVRWDCCVSIAISATTPDQGVDRGEHDVNVYSALLEAATQWLPRQARLAGLSAGLHLVLWLPMFPPSDEPRVVAAAREAGVGIYPLSPLFARSRPAGKDACAGFILGYASLSESRIRDGVRMLGKVLARLA